MGTLINNYDCLELTDEELKNTDGGFIPFLIAGAALLLASCSSQSNSSTGGRNNSQINISCTNCNVVVSGDTVKVYPQR